MSGHEANDPKIDVFFIGVGKCGTSWIYKHLSRRGDIGVPKIKEPYILNHPRHEQASQIEALYDEQRPRCDFSNVYYWDTSIPEKIAEHNPEAKIVLTVRKPSKRVQSHFAFLQRNGEFVDRGLVDYLNSGDSEQLVERSDYQRVLDRFGDALADDQLLVLPLELLAANTEQYAHTLAEFLGVPKLALSEEDTQTVLGRSSARSPFLSRAAKRLAGQLRDRGYLVALARLKELSIIQRMLFSQSSPANAEIDVNELPKRLKDLDAAYPNFLRRYGVHLN